MGLYNFKAQFVPFILRGSKTHTIRAKRRHPDKAGNILHLYTGPRTKKAKLLMRTTCVKVEEITIRRRLAYGVMAIHRDSIEIDGVALDPSEKELLARRDGFENFEEMMRFWDGRLPFSGHIIHWGEVRK